MTDPTNRYPLATANGDAIPHDVMKPQGLYVLNLSTYSHIGFNAGYYGKSYWFYILL